MIGHASDEIDLTSIKSSLLGFHIPQGAMIFPNLWAMGHNSQQYPDPEEFSPERYLVEGGRSKPMDTRLYCFGIGGR